MSETLEMELDISTQNPLIREIKAVLDQIDAFKKRVKAFYFDVVLSGVRCPSCGVRLRMTGQSECACSCGRVWDPTIEFQKSTCCGANLIRKTFHYSCSKCQRVVPSRFLFDERLFNREYFRAMMQESRSRAKDRKEEINRILTEMRSGVFWLSEDPDLGSIPGLLEDLDGFVKEGSFESDPIFLDMERPFDMERYREHILSTLKWDSIQFSSIEPCIEDCRKDRIWRFVTLVFMEHDREVDIEQVGDELFIQRHYHETYA
ncbi:MAG: hypothetical protein AB1798_06355 [Spirochaetota bacterium]